MQELATRAPAGDPVAGSDLVRAAMISLAAAIVAGVVWAYVVKITNYEIGIAAWGLGFLVGSAAVFAAGGRRSAPLAAVAVVAALVGILVGKYLTFVFIAKDELSGVAHVPVFSGNTWSFFMDNKDIVFSFWDVLWVGLAVATAFRIARPLAPPQAEPEPT